MPRRPLVTAGNLVYHVMNRGAKRSCLFVSTSDYSSFEKILAEAKAKTGMRLLVFCIMPNHWHLIVYPSSGLQLAQFMHFLTGTHAQRWQSWNNSVGTGAVYQGRYKAIPIQTDAHFLI